MRMGESPMVCTRFVITLHTHGLNAWWNDTHDADIHSTHREYMYARGKHLVDD